MQFNIQPLPIDKADWEAVLAKPLMEREGYDLNEEIFSYTQVAGAILGTPWDSFTYKEFLYNQAFGQNDQDNAHFFTSGTLDKHIDGNRLQEIQKLLNFHKESKGLSINRFVAFMEGKSLIPLKENKSYYIHLRNTYMHLLKTFEKQEGKLLHNDFNRILTDMVKWSWNHLKGWIEGLIEGSTENSNEGSIKSSNKGLYQQQPKIIWYGEATKSEVYFLYLLISLGVDVLAFHPEGKNIFSILKDVNIPVRTYPNTLKLEPIPTSKPMREATVAKKASAELEQILHKDGTFLFKPWQFREYIPQSVTLHTTYDEVRLISEAKAFVRPSFEVNDQNIYIPVLFSKICGISKDRRDYAEKYRELVESDLTVSLHKFPFSSEIKTNHQFHYAQAQVNGVLEPQRMKESNWWIYRRLPDGLQTGLANAISRYVAKAQLKPVAGEDVRHYLFSQAMELPADIIQLFQRFDYSQDVPKLILFNNGDSGELSRADAARLLLLNQFGFDIILLNPTGQKDLEIYIDSSLFDSHWLEDVSFDENHQKQLDLSCNVTRKKVAVKNLFGRFVSR